MLKSMTGFGLAQTEFASSRIQVEIKTLNSKFFELSVKLPRAYLNQEMLIRAEAQKALERGKISVSISLENLEASQARPARIDHALLKRYYTELSHTARELQAPETGLLEACLNLPRVISQDEEETSPGEWEQIYAAFSSALAATQGFRTDEGKVLEADISMRIALICDHLQVISESDTVRLGQIRHKIESHLEQYVGASGIDQNRLEQEMVYFVEKLDITEEKTRLKSHCDYFLENLSGNEPGGKKLGFISQEIGREINTIGSKVNDAQIQQRVVQMKDELEKIKEQLLNIL